MDRRGIYCRNVNRVEIPNGCVQYRLCCWTTCVCYCRVSILQFIEFAQSTKQNLSNLDAKSLWWRARPAATL